MKITDLIALPAIPPGVFERMDWAEEEIMKAQERHGEHGRGPIWRKGFAVVRQNEPYMANERLYRAHCREILDRLATGEDIRPGTDAEMIAVLHEASLGTPMVPGADCLIFRLMARVFPDLFFRKIMDRSDLDAYERIHGRAADDHETYLREKLFQKRG